MTDPIPMVIDRRAGSVDYADFFTKKEAVLGDLEFGDVKFSGNGPDGRVSIGVEIKKRGEFLDSMQSGRLAGHQLPGMLDHYDYSFIFIDMSGTRMERFKSATHDHEITQPGTRKRAFTDRQFYGFLTTLRTMAGVQVMTFGNNLSLARGLWILYQWWQKPWDGHGSINVIHRGNAIHWTGRTDPLVKLVSCIPGLGMKRANAVAKEFKSVSDMTKAGKSRWMRIEGIGPKLAENIILFLREGKSAD